MDRPARHARPFAFTSGFFLAVSPLPLAVTRWVHGGIHPENRPVFIPCLVTAALLLATALLLPYRPRWGRLAFTLGLAGLLYLGAPYLVHDPGATLSALLAGSAATAHIWNLGDPLLRRYLRRSWLSEGRVRGAALGSLTAWFAALHVRAGHPGWELTALGASFLLTGVVGLAWAWEVRRELRRRAAAVSLAFVAGCGLYLVAGGGTWEGVSAGTLMAVAYLFALPGSRISRMSWEAWWEPFVGHPARLLVGTFASLCVLGTLLLALPWSTRAPGSLGMVDSAFTAVSAVCVTGLIVRDTPREFSWLGQAWILLLIQLGGLGIMTFSAAGFRLLGRRMSLRYEGAVASLLGAQDRGAVFQSARRILAITVACEGAGTLLLTVAFLAHGDSVPMAIWRGLFTAVSAFCNAGFALQTDSLIGYASNPVVLHVVALLIVAGGLSPSAVVLLPRLVSRERGSIPSQTWLVLVSTGILLGLGFLLILALEWTGLLGGMSFFARLDNAWFQSVTLRTAGFNSVDLAAARPGTIAVMMLWMFIGGSPGGTAGGIKTTTAAVLVLTVFAAVRGDWRVLIRGRRVPERSLLKAGVVATLAVAVLGLTVVTLLVTQDMPASLAAFEAVSAFGTVGLSLGGTALLDGVGKIIIMGCMFAGRVGALMLFLFLGGRRGETQYVDRPEQEIDIG